MSLCGFLTCRPDLVTISECSSFHVGRCTSSICLGACFSFVSDDGLMGTSAPRELGHATVDTLDGAADA